jgi:aminoglycoside phosphotransferase (APT) family kinase protein
VAASAVAAVDRVLAAEGDAVPTLVHGDLNLHNLMWSHGRPSGLIDLDHAAWADPAVDTAPLIGAFGADRVSEIVAEDLLERSMHHRASLPLQVAAAAHIVGNGPLRDHALGNFVSRARSGTLHSPDGRAPVG